MRLAWVTFFATASLLAQGVRPAVNLNQLNPGAGSLNQVPILTNTVAGLQFRPGFINIANVVGGVGAGTCPANQVAIATTVSGVTCIALSLSSSYFSGILPVANGGSGTASPGLIAGTNINSITGVWPNQTINAAGGAVSSVFGQTGAVPNLSGDATTSGSSVVTVAKINGIAVTGTPAIGYVPTATSTSAATWQAQAGGITVCTGAGSASAQTCAGVPSGFALSPGAMINFVPSITMTSTTPTIAVNGTTASTVIHEDGTALSANELVHATNGIYYTLTFDGLFWEKSSGTVQAGPNGTISVTRGATGTLIDTTSQVCQLSNTCTPTGFQDWSGASATKPNRTAASDPGTCAADETYFNTVTNAMKVCGPANTWTALGAGGLPTLNTSGQGWECIPVCITNEAAGAVWTANQTRFYQYVAKSTMTITSIVFILNAGGGSNVGAAMYDATCTSKLANVPSTAMGGGVNTITFTAPFNQVAGTVYHFGITSDAATMQINGENSFNVLPNTLNANANAAKKRYFSGTASVAAAMPASCGTRTGLVGNIEFFLGTPD